MALIFDLKIYSESTKANIGFIKDSIDPLLLIKTNKVEEIVLSKKYKYNAIPLLDEFIFKYFKCYSGSYIQIHETIEYTITITFFVIIHPELITEKVIENSKILQIFAMATLIETNMINTQYDQYRQDKFIKDIEKVEILDLSFSQPEYIKTQLWSTQKNNIQWLIKLFSTDNKIRFSNNIYIKLPNDLIIDYTATTKVGNTENKFISKEDIPEQNIRGAIICDDPSMGKSLQIITFASYMYYNNNVRSLIVYPDHLKGHWQKQSSIHIKDGINYKNYLKFMSFTQFSKVIKFEEINDNEILIIDEYHETYDSKKTNNYRVYENSIRFPFKFKIGLTSTPFITNNSLLKIIQYLCSKSFYNTSIAYHPELQNEFIKFFKRNLIVNNTNEIKIPDVNIVNVAIEFNRYEKDIYDTISNTLRYKTLLDELKTCCDVYLLFESNVNSMKTPKDLKADTLTFFQTKYYNDYYQLKELEEQYENIKNNKNDFKTQEYLSRLKHYENQILLKKDVVDTRKSTLEYYKNAIEKIEKITNNDETLDGDDVCAICLSEHQDPIAFFKKCGHYFCKECIEEVKLKTCPICRGIINNDDILYVTNTFDITLGSKFVQLINQLKNTDESFIIFTQFPKLIENIKYALDKFSIDNITFNELIESTFNKKAKAIIMSSDANASGIDELSTISNMIIFEPFLDYSYGKQIEKQLIGRIRRTGQKKDVVNVYRYYIRETIEEKIYL
jgi:hypothetical protein